MIVIKGVVFTRVATGLSARSTIYFGLGLQWLSHWNRSDTESE